MSLNIPIYRAKKIDSDEYITGQIQDFRECTPPSICIGGSKIDQSTLAIHFPTMPDSDGKKIFASLDSDKGIGGDILYHKPRHDKSEKYEWTIVIDKHRFNPFGVRNYWNPPRVPLFDLIKPFKSKIIGIQK